MALPTPFTTTTPFLTSVNFTNLLEGTSGIIFYPGNALDEDAAQVNIMSSTPFESSSKDTSISANAASSTLIATHTYKLSTAINPNTLKGKGIITFGWGIRGNNNNQGNSAGYIICRLVANGVTIGEGKSNTRTGTAGAYAISGAANSTVTFDITETLLRVGEELSVVFLIYGHRSSGSSGGYIVVGHDPDNNDGAYIKPSEDDVDTTIKAQVPFKIE
tara:strand:+ start:2022 stop:2675 length:654 start_codon:yes stop_codon:yes gene_type:complete